MKFLYWSVGVMQILTGIMLAWSIAPGWRWVWLTLAVLWFFVGVGLLVVRIAKLVTDKVSAGGARVTAAGRPHPPAPQKEE
jgi:hypothetical protein